MALYRTNIGGLDEAVRVAAGATVAVAALVYLAGGCLSIIRRRDERALVEG